MHKQNLHDEWRTPLHVAEAARQIVELGLDSSCVEIVHLNCEERCNRWELGKRIVSDAGQSTAQLKRASRLEMEGPDRPADVSLC